MTNNKITIMIKSISSQFIFYMSQENSLEFGKHIKLFSSDLNLLKNTRSSKQEN